MVGSTNVTTYRTQGPYTGCAAVLSVRAVHAHPDYNGYSYENDIALLEVDPWSCADLADSNFDARTVAIVDGDKGRELIFDQVGSGKVNVTLSSFGQRWDYSVKKYDCTRSQGGVINNQIMTNVIQTDPGWSCVVNPLYPADNFVENATSEFMDYLQVVNTVFEPSEADANCPSLWSTTHPAMPSPYSPKPYNKSISFCTRFEPDMF